MSDDIAIRIKGVSKTFRLPHDKAATVKNIFVRMFRRQGFETQQVLKDISFNIKKGEFFGIVGRNGSGKSTLLKLLAGIYEPTHGSIQTQGHIVPFIELGVGFNPELTGRENVYLNGALLGFTRKRIDAMYNDIVAFAELERFMDQKLKNYSSGMQVRLAFSVAIRANTDILLIDEVLAVGDENFQRKCYDFFAKVKRQKKTVIFVSHDMDAVRDFCTKAVLIHDGNLIKEGKPSDVVTAYTKLNFDKTEHDIEKKNTGELARWGDGSAVIKKVWTSKGPKKQSTFMPNDTIDVHISVKAAKPIDKPVIGMILQDAQGRVVFATNSKEMNQEVKSLAKDELITATFSIPNIFTNGNYSISCAIASYDRTETYSRVERAHQIAVAGWGMSHSMTHPKHSLKVT